MDALSVSSLFGAVGRTLLRVAVTALVCVIPCIAEAQTWKPTPNSGDWTNGTNWVGDVAPSDAGDTAVFDSSTHSGFSTFYLIGNSEPDAATVEITYLLPAPAVPLTKTYVIAPHSRYTIHLNLEDPLLDATDVSAIVRSINGVPVAVERAMYFNRGEQLFGAGQANAAILAPSTQWQMAEGGTGSYFDTFLLLANPNTEPASATVTYMGPLGPILTRSYTIGPRSRYTVWVDLEDPLLADTPFGVTITSDLPIVTERTMWWPGTSSEWQESHSSAGAPETGTRWGIADGELGGPTEAETYFLITNSSTELATVNVTLFFEDGTPAATKSYIVAAGTRFSVSVRDEFPAAEDKRFGAVVESTGVATPIVVERSTYGNADGLVWATGVNALATRLQ